MDQFNFIITLLFINTIFQLVLFFINTIKLKFNKVHAFKLMAYFIIFVSNIFTILPVLYKKNILTGTNVIIVLIILLISFTLNFLFDEEFIFNFTKIQNFIINLVLSTITYIIIFSLFI